MGGVLGVSVGAGFVRLVRLRDLGTSGTPAGIERQSVVVVGGTPEEVAAEAVGVVVSDAAESGSVVGVCIAYDDEAQAAALDAALRRQGVTQFRLVPESTAVLAGLGRDHGLAALRTFALYDLGASGLTVSVVDRSSGAVAASERSTALCGEDLNGVSRETSGAATDAAIVDSADLVGELVEQSGMMPDAVVLLGGGANVPEVRAVLQQHSAVPVLVPVDPEFVAATGAALLADPVVRPVAPARRSSRRSRGEVSRRQVNGAGLAGVALVLIALTGLGLGYGRTFFGPEAGASTDTPTATFPPQSPAPPPTSDVPLPPTAPAQPAADAGTPTPVQGQPNVPGPRPATPSPEPLPFQVLLPFEIPQLPPSVPLPPLPVPSIPDLPGLLRIPEL